jgi:polar amino acid transport system substrate-binding protein
VSGAIVTALLVVLLLPTGAAAMTRAKVTLDEETGGQLTRFTVQATSEDDALIKEIVFTFPEGFDTTESLVTMNLLEGLNRIKADFLEVRGAENEVKILFNTPVPPGSNLFIELNNVMTPIAGGEYELNVTYSAETTVPVVAIEERRLEPLTFSYATPPREEIWSRWLDNQGWVKAWTSVAFLNIFLRPQQLIRAIPLLFEGWLLSLALVLTSFPVAIIGGLATAFMKMSKIPPVRWIAGFYINVIRGTPLFLQIFVVFIGLRTAGIRLPDFVSAIAVLAFNSSAYLAEIFRAGIQSISKGQFEAASSLGMTYRQAMQYVIIPQTVRRVLPTMTSEFILLFKDTALFAAVGLFELMLRSQNFVARSGNLSAYVIAACYYLIVTIPLINLVGRLEARLAQSEHGVAATPGRRKRGELLTPALAGGADAFTHGAEAAVGGGPQTDFDNSPAKHESR